MNVSVAEDAFEWLNDPIVNRYMPYPIYTNIESVKKWILSLDRNVTEFAFVLKDENKVIGAGGITGGINYKKEFDAFELGYNINRKYWGHGLATEASKALLD